jgi:hypothetical protein
MDLGEKIHNAAEKLRRQGQRSSSRCHRQRPAEGTGHHVKADLRAAKKSKTPSGNTDPRGRKAGVQSGRAAPPHWPRGSSAAAGY